MKREILTKDKSRLVLFENNIVVDKKLLKWRNAEFGLQKTTVEENGTSFIMNNNRPITSYNTTNSDIDSDVNSSTKWLPLYEVAKGINFDDLAMMGLKDLNRLMAETKLKFVIGGYGSFGNTVNVISMHDSQIPRDPSIWDRIKDWVKHFKVKHKENKEINIDVIQFFSTVKSSTKESFTTYRDRIQRYLSAIHSASVSGQEALLESLLKGMITNKYEAVLYSEGLYYVINEELMVSFIKQCEKGIKLDYIKNFNRPLPIEITKKIEEVNNLEIFDNYVVLYYDPDGEIYKETAKEEAKRKDPILFGVIAGSNKLYYVADWVDEYCDLTLEKYLDICHINYSDIHMDGDDSKDKKAKKTNKRKKYKRKKTNIKTE